MPTTAYFYPRPPRGGRRLALDKLLRAIVISIHALREEGDMWTKYRQRSQSISIHALREEGDTDGFSATINFAIFLSTPSVRRATPFCQHGPQHLVISIHALREEGDCAAEGPARPSWRFLSTPSVRRATIASLACSSVNPSFLSTPSVRRATESCSTRAMLSSFLSTPSARRAT